MAQEYYSRMDHSASTNSILDTLRTVEFRLGLKGYNVDEVDEYLEKAAVEAEQVQERLKAADERLRQATERIAQLEAEPERAGDRATAPQPPTAGTAASAAPSGATEEALQRTLLLAQKFVDETKRESESEAAQVVSRAEEQARTLLAQAEDRARQLTTEAEDRLRDEVGRLEATRTRLAADVETMNRHLDEQRTKIRDSLAEALRWVDERMQPPAPRPAPERAQEGSAPPAPPAAPPRRHTGAGAPSAGRADGAGVGSGGSPPGGGGARPNAAPDAPAQPDRQAPAGTPSHSGPERTQAAVGARLGVLNGGLFGAGREGTGAEEHRLGD